MNYYVETFCIFDDGSAPGLYAGGWFTTAGGVSANRIAKWDGKSWSPLGSGVDAPSQVAVQALAPFDDGTGPALYVGGSFDTAGGLAAMGIARWDGQAWSALGDGIYGRVNALAVLDDGGGAALYAGGYILEAGGFPVNHLAKWDGQRWSDVGAGVGSGQITPVRALAVYDDGTGPALYVGGWFTTAGGQPANSIARWDGKSWSPLGIGITGYPAYVTALTVFDDGTGPALFVGGGFYYAGGLRANSIAKWDGTSWSPLGTGMSSAVESLVVYDDGTGNGPALYAGGFFRTAGGVTADRIARWDGTSWSALGMGLDYEVWGLGVFDDGAGPGLYAGGQFTMAGGEPANRIAHWRGCIPGDLDNDRDVDAADFADFLRCYNGAMRPPPATCPESVDADLDNDGDVDLDDFSIFAANYTGSR